MGTLGIELSALSAHELKRLLELARSRGQSTLAAQLSAELASRTGAWRPPPLVAAHPRQPGPADGRDAAAAAGRRARGSLAAAAVGLVVVALAWGLALPISLDPLARARGDAAPDRPMAMAALAPVLPAEGPELPAQVEIAPAGAPPQPAAVRLAKAEARPSPQTCYDEPTAAERLVCGFPALAERHRRMLSAYRAARTAGADPQVLDGAQSAWRRRSENVSDRHLLADLYEERIRELQADAAAARATEPRT